MAYTPEEIENAKSIIIDEMIEGDSVVTILKRHEELPRIRTVMNWLNPEHEKHDPSFLQNYARAQEIRAEREFEEIKKIADSTDDDIIEVDGKKQINHHVINRDRLRVDARKWRISKMQPKKYGDKLDLTSGGKGISKTEPVEVVVKNYKKD